MVGDRLYCVQQKCSSEDLVFSDVSFMAIFAKDIKNECIIESMSTCAIIDTLRDSL